MAATDTNRMVILELGQWKVNTFPFKKVFPRKLIPEAQALLNKWAQVFPKEETWVQRKYKIPSFITRLDCVWQEEENFLGIYEIEGKPAGIGITSYINPDFRERLSKILKEWPSILVVISKKRQRQEGDDFLWTKTILGEGYFPFPPQHKVLVRAEPNEQEFWSFEPFSVSLLRKEGDKGYGISLGLWFLVTSENQLPWDEGFALKPLQGSKCRGIEIYHPKRENGISTRSRIRRRLQELGRMYCQFLIPPMEFGKEVPEEIKRFHRHIGRIYFAYLPSTSQWECLGGVWNARPNWRIHGAADACLGPLVPEEK